MRKRVMGAGADIPECDLNFTKRHLAFLDAAYGPASPEPKPGHCESCGQPFGVRTLAVAVMFDLCDSCCGEPDPELNERRSFDSTVLRWTA